MMKSNFRSLKALKLATAASAAALLGSAAAEAAPLISIGERGAIFFNGSVTLRADDNVFLNGNNEESDVIFIFSPGVEFTYGGDSVWNFSAYYREDIYRYTDNTELDSSNSNVFLNANYARERLSASFDASFQQLTQNTFDLAGEGDLVERDRFRVGVDGEYDLSELLDVGGGVSYQETDFEDGTRFSDTEIVTVPVDLYYNWRPTVDLSLGYRFRDSSTDAVDNLGRDRDSNDHFFNIGARGEITPTIVGSVKLGYQQRSFDDSDISSEDGFAAEADATWDATSRMNVMVNANRDFRYSARGATIETSGVGARISYLLTELVTGSAGIDYQDWEYLDTDRDDEKWTGDLGLSYAPNDYVDLSAAYIYTNNQSNIQSADLDRNIFQLTASLRY